MPISRPAATVVRTAPRAPALGAIRSHRAPAALSLAAAVALALAACATPAREATPAPETTPAPQTTVAGDAVPGFPVTVASCGVEATVPAPPQRIVTIKSSATEMVLALGAGDRLVGTAYPDGEVPAELADAAADVPLLAERNPAAESVLELEPDLVYAGWESNLTADGAGERSMYASVGVPTYVSPSACQGEHQPERLTFEHVFAEIEEVGAILGQGEAAAALVAEQQARLAAVQPSAAGLSALWYSSGSETPYVGAGTGAPQMIMDAVGLENVAGDVDATWASLSWEAVADRGPDVIVLVDSAWNTAEHKMDVLRGNPVTAALPAVQQERYLTVPFPATEAGVRNVSAVRDLAAQLTELR